MSEEEIKEFLNKYKDCKCDLREYNSCIECENKVKQAIQGLLDLYNKEKEKNKLLIEGKFREVAYKNSYIKDNYVSKDRIKEEIKELENMKVDGEVFTTAVNFAKKEFQKLLEEENV